MSKKAPVSPVWWKNTFFLFGFMLLAVAVVGVFRGESTIRDPGQKFETGLVVFYFVGGVAMLVNGWLTHAQSVQAFQEYNELHGDGPGKTVAVASDSGAGEEENG